MNLTEVFQQKLSKLKSNDLYKIRDITNFASENQQYTDAALEISNICLDHILKVAPPRKITALYALDSILKNVGAPYVALVQPHICAVFTHTFQAVQIDARRTLYKVRNTWMDVFPAELLLELDIRMQAIDPKWPIQHHATPSQKAQSQLQPSQPPEIHTQHESARETYFDSGSNSAATLASPQLHADTFVNPRKRGASPPTHHHHNPIETSTSIGGGGGGLGLNSNPLTVASWSSSFSSTSSNAHPTTSTGFADGDPRASKSARLEELEADKILEICRQALSVFSTQNAAAAAAPSLSPPLPAQLPAVPASPSKSAAKSKSVTPPRRRRAFPPTPLQPDWPAFSLPHSRFIDVPTISTDPRLLCKIPERFNSSHTTTPPPPAHAHTIMIGGRRLPLLLDRLQPCVEISGALHAVRLYVRPPQSSAALPPPLSSKVRCHATVAAAAADLPIYAQLM